MNQLARSVFICFPPFLALAAASPADGQPQAPPPQVVRLETRDGVQLNAKYYPSRVAANSAGAKQVTPVVLLHDFKDTQAVFASLAQRLQTAGGEVEAATAEASGGPSFAVMTVDLRGHGQSTKQLSPAGQQVELDAARFTKEHFLAMAALDMEQVRSFLVGKNDAGELNLNKLCIAGAGMGASVGVNWAALDWSAPPLAIGKQGQDVKGLVLISPRWSYRGLTILNAMKLRPLKENVAWMLIYGSEDSKVKADARRLFKQLERFHPEPEEAKQSRDLVALGWPSSLQGSTLLSQVGAPIETEIVDFLSEHVATQDAPWMARRKRAQ